MMHNNSFLEDAKMKIVRIVDIESDGRCVIADLITTQFSRVTQRRFTFENDEWERVKERGWVE